MIVVYLMLLVHAISAFKPPTIEVEEHLVQEHHSIGRYVELSEHQRLTLKCSGRYDDLKYIFPDMEDHKNYDQENFENRVEEFDDDAFGDRVLTINDVRESDTGTYSCTSLEHVSLNDTIHVFVHGSSVFVPLKTVAYVYPENQILVPCKTTKFIDKNEIELFANKQLVKTATKGFDQRVGFKLTKKMYDEKPFQNIPFECRYNKQESKAAVFYISEQEDENAEDDFKFYWEKKMDWPYVGYNYTITCHLAYTGPIGKFHPFYNKLLVECPQCSSSAGSRAFADSNRLHGNEIVATIRVESMSLEDTGKYKCIWKHEGKPDQIIEENVQVAPKRAQIKLLERSPQIIRMKEGHPVSLSAKFAIYPNDEEGYNAKWSRMYNSSIKDGLQSENIINDDYRTTSTKHFGPGVFSDNLDIKGNAITANTSGTYVLSISHLDTVQVVQWEVAIENEESDVQIAIREPSSFIVFNQQFYPSNTHLHIDCISVSIPPAEVYFEQRADRNADFEGINPGDLTSVSGTFERGFIWNVTLVNDMEIRCSSVRGGERKSTSKSIYVADKAPHATAEILKSEKATESEDEKTIYEGDSIKLKCVVPSGAADWKVFWRFENRLKDSVTENEDHSKYVVLLLEDVTSDDSGKYTCVVKSADSEKHLDKFVTVEKASRPYHTNADSMESVKVDYDKSFVIDCNMAGNPAPTYEWYKDGHPYTHGEVDGSKLTVTRSRAEDDGEFQCLATNRAGSTNNKISVNVRGAPKASWFLTGLLGFVLVILAAVCIAILWKYLITKKENKQKDIALINMYNDFIRNNPGPPPEEMKDLPINERVYYLSYDREYEIAPENLEELDVLGSGNFGVVNKGLLSMADPKSQIEYKTRLPVAIKRAANKYDISQQRMISDELKIMCAIGRHPNVLALVGAMTNNMRQGQLCIVTELVECGNLREYLSKHRDVFKNELVDEEIQIDDSYMVPNSVRKKYNFENNGETSKLLNNSNSIDTLCTSDLISFGLQIANGMEYLASIPCVHRDLATRNILLTKSKIVRIADFGLAKQHNKRTYYQTMSTKNVMIPVRWMSLEALENHKFTEASDVWAFAITLFEIFTLGGTPYPDVANQDVLVHVKNGNKCRQPDYCHDDIYAFMRECWANKPADRPTFSKCVHFFKHHLETSSSELLEHVDTLLRLETEHQMKLDEWIKTDRADNGCSFTKPAKKPADERYLIVESHA